jgi:hypothetical protein
MSPNQQQEHYDRVEFVSNLLRYKLNQSNLYKHQRQLKLDQQQLVEEPIHFLIEYLRSKSLIDQTIIAIHVTLFS